MCKDAPADASNSLSNCFWRYLVVVLGGKTLNKLKNTRKTQFSHLKKSFVLLFFVILQSDNGMVAKPLIRILRIHVDVSCISKRWFAFVSLDKAVLFVDKRRFDDALLEEVSKDYEIRPYESVYEDIASLTRRGVGYYSPEKVSYAFAPAINKKRNVRGRDITTDLKARKNPVELEGMRRAHFLDGVAFAKLTCCDLSSTVTVNAFVR